MARVRKTSPDDAPSRARILETAGRLFARKGYAATSVDEVAAEARTSKSSIYWHFKSKEDILLAVLTENTSNWAAHAVSVIAARETPAERLEAALDVLEDQLQQTRDFRQLVLGMMTERAEESPRTRAVLQEIYQGYRDATVKQIADTVPALPPAQRDAIAAVVLAISDGLFLHWQLDPENFDLHRTIESLRALLVPVAKSVEKFINPKKQK
ncbi:MAG: TetR/AcrR family transcriptional regulator [Chrysiogenetes bacterium]|nr:TetR/AcrR family transcriptional regulator [Chrysiogenetes bacterium]